jgi:apolipoprotein N-acyltransferase
MQASQLRVRELSDPDASNWWHGFTYVDKLPFALLFGALLGLSTPGFEHAWLAFVGLAPLLVLLSLCRSAGAGLLTGFCFGLGYHLVSMSWYFGLYPLGWMGLNDILSFQTVGLAWLLESAHEALIFALFAWVVSALPSRNGYLASLQRPFFPYLLVVPLVWYFLNWIISPSVFFFGIPVDQLVYSQSKNTPFIQLAKIGGAGLVESLIVLFNAALAALIVEFPKTATAVVDRIDKLSPRIGSIFDLSVVFAVIMLSMAWGNAQIGIYSTLDMYRNPKATFSLAPRLTLAVVQGNVTAEEDRLRTATALDVANREKNLSEGLGVGLIVLPEGVLNASQRQAGFLLSDLEAIAKGEKKEVIAGSYSRLNGSFVNSAVMIAPDKAVKGRSLYYLKTRLIPFFEMFPWQEIHNGLPDLLKEKLPAFQETFTIASQPSLLTSTWGKVGVSISAELIYPQVIAREVRKGASLLVNVSNLSWFRASTLNRQMLAVAVFRAVENERFLVLSSNTGTSAIIDPSGVVVSSSSPGRRGTLIDTVQFLVDKTPFTKMWWL